MSVSAEPAFTSRYDRVFKLFQTRLADQVKTPFEISIGEDRSYRLGSGEHPLPVLIKNCVRLAALSELDEVKICESYMDGSLDVVGDMLGFVSLRGMLSDNHPLYALWQL